MKAAEAGGFLQLEIGGKPALPRIRVADHFNLRSLGLMGRKQIPDQYGAGLFFFNCRSLHACFMRFELEVWFLDAEGQPVGGARRLKPWGLAIGPKAARHCLEILPGALKAPAGVWEWTHVEDATPLAYQTPSKS